MIRQPQDKATGRMPAGKRETDLYTPAARTGELNPADDPTPPTKLQVREFRSLHNIR